ncbi:MAG: hypothetical protein ACD_28C00356G0001, partial [uncultured bacterium]
MVTTVTLKDEDGVELGNSQTFSSGLATFSNLDWWVDAGQTERLIVEVDVDRSATPHNSTNDNFGVDLADVSAHVVAEDEDGNTVTSGSSDNPNGGTTPTRVISVKEAGLVTVAASDNPVRDDKAIAGNDSTTNPLLVGRFKVSSQDEAFKVTKMVFRNDSTNTMVDNSAVKQVMLKYPTSLSAPDTLDGSSTVTLVSGDATFTGLTIMVPESDTDENSVDVEVYVVTNSFTDGTTTGDSIELDFEESTGFEAVGQGSGTTVTHGSASTLFGTTADVDANSIALYKSLPNFDKDTASTAPCPTSTIVPSASSEVYCFKVTASSTGDIGLRKITLDATPNLLNTGSSAGQLAEAAGWKIKEYQASGTKIEETLATGTWASNLVALTFTAEEVVSKGTTSYYLVEAPIAFTTSDDSSSLSVRLAAETSSITAHSASV